MKCAACGREINDNTKFCKYCGEPIKSTQGKIEGRMIKCSSCGAIVKPGTLFCTQCGNSLDKKTKNKKTRKRYGIVFAIFLCVVSIGLLSAHLIRSRYLSRDKNTDIPKEEKADVIQEDRNQKKEIYSDEINDYNDNTSKGDTSSIAALQDDDFESDILKITNDKNEIDRNIHSGIYDSSTDKNGVICYEDNSTPAAIFVPEDYKKDGYQRNYYFADKKLIFAELLGADHHQFFFKDDQLLRWRYSSEATNENITSEYDKESTEPYLQWQQRILDESNEMLIIVKENYKNSEAGASDFSYDSIEVSSRKTSFYGIWIAASKDENEAKTYVREARNNGVDAQLFITTDWDNLNSEKWYVVSAGVYMDSASAENALKEVQEIYPDSYVKFSGSNIDEYILPGSDKRYISSSELNQLSQDEIRTAINELYARHGRKFADKAIQKYFELKSWYSPRIEPDDFTEDVFNDYELKNKETLVEWEESHGWREKNSSAVLQ